MPDGHHFGKVVECGKRNRKGCVPDGLKVDGVVGWLGGMGKGFELAKENWDGRVTGDRGRWFRAWKGVTKTA
jgi:hypothetical protein